MWQTDFYNDAAHFLHIHAHTSFLYSVYMPFVFHTTLHVLRVYFLPVGTTGVRQNFQLLERATYILYCRGLCNSVSPENQSHVLECSDLRKETFYMLYIYIFYSIFTGNWLCCNGVSILIFYVPVNRRIDLKSFECRTVLSYWLRFDYSLCCMCTQFHSLSL